MFSKMQANGNNKAAAKRETPRLKTSTPQIINREIPSIILLEQARRDPSQMNPAGILQLQRAIGNQSLQRFLQDQMENSESFDTAIMRQAGSATGQATVPQLENWPDVSSDNDVPDGNWAGTKERPDLRFGVQGKDVVYLQRRLLLYGFDLVEDGIFGAKTQKAVMAFQRDYAPPADGVVGPITWAALDRSPNLAASGQQKGPASQVGFVGGTPGVAAPGATSKVPDVFGSLVARDLIDREIADLLNEMYQIGGWAQESAHFAHTELSNGNLIGLVSAANSMTKIQPRLHKKHHADLASFAAGMMTTNGGQMKGFEETGGYLRGLILFGPPRLIAAATSKAEREFTYLLLAHELTHHRNRVQGARLMKEGEKNKLSTSIYVDPKLANSFSGTAHTRNQFINELVCRHIAWRVKWATQSTTGAPALTTGQFFRVALQFAALDFNGYQDNGYMKALQQKDQSKFREQVALWLVSLGGMLYHNDPVKNTEIQVFMQLEYMNAVALNYAEPTVPAAGLA